jgi:hypothetical protein
MRELTRQELDFVSGGVLRSSPGRIDLRLAIRERIASIFRRIADRLGGRKPAEAKLT